MLQAECAPYAFSHLNFYSGSPDTSTTFRNFGFFITNTSICDTSGNLLFYTNGVKIGNANHDTLWNSDNFNPGFASTQNCEMLSSPQAALILPMPGWSNLYYLLHESGDQFFAYNSNHVSPLALKYSLIDMTLDNNLGGMDPATKNVIAINDTMANGFLTACKHGNGRDWWIIAPRFWSNGYYKLLLSPSGLDSVSYQEIGDSLLYDINGQAVFSPDGNYYAIVDNVNNLNIFRFDRCSGLFYDSTYIEIPNPTPSTLDNRTMGLAFSASSRFLYVTLFSRIIQFDMYSPNISLSQTYVAEWDTFYNPFATNFFNAQLAPDNRIYIGTYAGCYNLHYIEYPDSLGLSCNVVQNSFDITSTLLGNIAVPTFANHSLGSLIGSTCDTLTSVNLFHDENIMVDINPIPANNYFKLSITSRLPEVAFFYLYNSSGVEMSYLTLSLEDNSMIFNSENLISGIYFWKIVFRSGATKNGKLVIIH